MMIRFILVVALLLVGGGKAELLRRGTNFGLKDRPIPGLRKLKGMMTKKDSKEDGGGGIRDDTVATSPTLPPAEPSLSPCDQCKTLCSACAGSSMIQCKAVCAFIQKPMDECNSKCANYLGLVAPPTVGPTNPAPTTQDNRDDVGTGITNPTLPVETTQPPRLPANPTGVCEHCVDFCKACKGNPMTACQEMCAIATASDCEAQCYVKLYGSDDFRDDTGTNPNIGPPTEPDYCQYCIDMCNTCSSGASCKHVCRVAASSNCTDWCKDTLHLPW